MVALYGKYIFGQFFMLKTASLMFPILLTFERLSRARSNMSILLNFNPNIFPLNGLVITFCSPESSSCPPISMVDWELKTVYFEFPTTDTSSESSTLIDAFEEIRITSIWVLNRILVEFDQFSGSIFYFWPKFLFLAKISIFDQNFHFWPKFPFLTKISIFDQNFHLWPKFLKLWLEFDDIVHRQFALDRLNWLDHRQYRIVMLGDHFPTWWWKNRDEK